MCGSTDNSRTQAFSAAAAFFATQSATNIVKEGETGPMRQHIAFVTSVPGAGEAPAIVLALADAEDKVLEQVRAVQLAQQSIISRLLDEYTVSPYNSRTETLVASLNNLADAIKVHEAAQKAYDDESDRVEAEIRDAFGASDANPILQ